MINDYQLLAILRVTWAGLPMTYAEENMLRMHPERCAELEKLYRWDDHK